MQTISSPQPEKRQVPRDEKNTVVRNRPRCYCGLGSALEISPLELSTPVSPVVYIIEGSVGVLNIISPGCGIFVRCEALLQVVVL